MDLGNSKIPEFGNPYPFILQPASTVAPLRRCVRKGFSARYHSHRDTSREIVTLVVRANNTRNKMPVLEELRIKIEEMKVLIRICKEVKAFETSLLKKLSFPTAL